MLAAGIAGSALRVALGGGLPKPFLAFAIAAAMGTWLRLQLTERWPRHGRGMIAANLLGTFVFAVFWKYTPLAVDTAPVLLGGFCGALTTFSGFVAELLRRIAAFDVRGSQRLFALAFVAAFALVFALVGKEAEPPQPTFPFGTMAANLCGCLLFGVLDQRLRDDAWRRITLGGFLGGLTTFSSLIFETHQLLCGPRGANVPAVNLMLTAFGGMALMALGRFLACPRYNASGDFDAPAP